MGHKPDESMGYTLIDKARLDFPGMDVPDMAIIACRMIDDETGRDIVVAAHALPSELRGELAVKRAHLDTMLSGMEVPMWAARLFFGDLDPENYGCLPVEVHLIDGEE